MNIYGMKILLLVSVLFGHTTFAAQFATEVSATAAAACGAGGGGASAAAGAYATADSRDAAGAGGSTADTDIARKLAVLTVASTGAEACPFYTRTADYNDMNPASMFSWVRAPYTIAQLCAWKCKEDAVPKDAREIIVTHPGRTITRTGYGATYSVIQRIHHDALEYAQRLSASLPADGTVKIMDLGCGDGFMTRCFSFIPRTEFLLVDILESCTQKAVLGYIKLTKEFAATAKRGGVARAVGDWGSMDVTKYRESVDLVWAGQCLHFMGAKTPKAFSNIKDCLKPGGVLMGMVQVPSLGLSTPELLEESLKPGYVPGVIGLKVEYAGNVPHYAPFSIKAKNLKDKPVGFMYDFYNSVTVEKGRGVTKDGFTQVNQWYNEALLRKFLRDAGLDVVDLYHTNPDDSIVDAGDKTAGHICFVARKGSGA